MNRSHDLDRRAGREGGKKVGGEDKGAVFFMNVTMASRVSPLEGAGEEGAGHTGEGTEVVEGALEIGMVGGTGGR